MRYHRILFAHIFTVFLSRFSFAFIAGGRSVINNNFVQQNFKQTGKNTLFSSSKLQTNSGSIFTTEYDIQKKDHPLAPPLPLQNLPLHTTIRPFTSMPEVSIARIANDPHLFLFENFLTSKEEINSLMVQGAEQGMEYSGTKTGQVKQRIGSYTGWIYQCEACDEEIKLAHRVSSHMTQLSSAIFIPNHLNPLQAEKNDDWSLEAEPVQIVRYEPGGKFDVHHDGFNRFLTCLTYCNGVAGTWFPYAILDENLTNIAYEDGMPDMSSGNVAEDKTPGKDGVIIVGANDRIDEESRKHVVRVKEGDAIVFYNYDWIENHNTGSANGVPPTGPLMNWRSAHSGVKTSVEKWIATNWFRFNIDSNSGNECETKK